ncbi:MAG: aspartate-semialdehyde dehydrogenase [Armatimonadetes bacterium]|nr:aspartate-semialdehyde dehydrogenase [Armatimonadota bacterium]
MGEYNVAVIGVGAVGEEMLKVLVQRDFPARQIKVLARSAREVTVAGRTFQVEATATESFDGVDIALFAGTEGEKGASVMFSQEAINRGAVVIDNGADFRMDPKVPLVVPEVNAHDLEWHQGIIANPNCSTIQMVVALKPLHERSRIKRVIASTYQAVSGTGRSAIEELAEQSVLLAHGQKPKKFSTYPMQIAFNVLPQIGGFREDGYTSEEWKMRVETRKILGDPDIQVSATTVRVPVYNGHSESIYIETEEKISAEEACKILSRSPGIQLVDQPAASKSDPHARTYPVPLEASGKDDTYVGRVREDPDVATGLHMWVVSDNIRKGAALNAVQIAETLIQKGLLKGGR